ncbi:hypothetical protein AX15_001526 [Amanita polypyramis BW_CC]|nr:hypothetical protein AX15_001526 [Amanita polypyramis BW_CC]
MTTINTGFFHGASHFTIAGGNFTEVHGDYIINSVSEPQMAPLPPMKHSSDLFTGRHSYLRILEDYFGSHSMAERKSYLLYGMGGIGKTQICLKFLEQFAHLFSDIFWIDASSEATIDLRLRQILKAYNFSAADSTPSAGSALRWIATRQNWLIVYDNADGGYEVVEKFLPPGNGGNILVTSRNRVLRRVTQGNSIEVDKMDEEEAVSLLLRSTMLDNHSEEIKGLARSIVSAVGNIPLAVDQAGAYILTTGCDLDYYLNLYNQHHSQLMSNATFRGASNYGYSTYGTWEISIQEIQKRALIDTGPDALAAQSAIMLHKILAFLHHDNILEEIFSKAAENNMKNDIKEQEKLGFPLSVTLLDPQSLFLNAEGEWDKIHFLSGIQVLTSFSLIKTTNKIYSIHPLVQDWSKDRIPKPDATVFHGITRAILGCSVNPDEHEDNYVYCGALIPHIRESNRHAAQLKLKEVYYIDQCVRFAFVFERVGDWKEAEKLYMHGIEVTKAKLGVEHPYTLTIMNNLAYTYKHQGRWDEAEELQVHVMEARKTKLGADHPDTLVTMHSLASTYWNQGRWDEAEKLNLHVMEARKVVLGVDNPHTLSTMHNLASTYKNQGRWDEAEMLEMHVMEAKKDKLGADHPDTITTMHNLASTYWNQGRWDEAENLGMHVMKARKAKLGADHPDTLSTMHNMASTYTKQGRLYEAEKLQVDVMNIRKAKLGADHPDTLVAMSNLAAMCWNQERWDEAEKLQVHVMETSKAKLGAEHPSTLTTMHSLASTYSKQGRWDEAEKLEVYVMGAKKAKLGADHPSTLTTMHNLAFTYMNQGRWDEAEELQVHVVEVKKAKLGADHPSTLTSIHDLATTYWSQGKWDEAGELELLVMKASKIKLGKGHSHTSNDPENQPVTSDNEGNLDEGEILSTKVVRTTQQSVASANVITLHGGEHLQEMEVVSHPEVPNTDNQYPHNPEGVHQHRPQPKLFSRIKREITKKWKKAF